MFSQHIHFLLKFFSCLVFLFHSVICYFFGNIFYLFNFFFNRPVLFQNVLNNFIEFHLHEKIYYS